MDYSNKTILIIEDEDALQAAFKKGFEARGFKVVTANDGRDGFELIKNVRPDIVILDLIMPNMNGEEVLQAMHDQGINDVPVIVVTNKSDGASLYNCKKLGAKEYLIKVNVSLSDILVKIDEIFEAKS
jgi:DNA-binding response OmpR family regulator